MPTYEYKCPKCGTRFERFQRITDAPRAKCPKCGARAERQLSGGHGIVFKGSGFYETDYKRKAEKKTGKDGSKDSGSSGAPPAAGSSGSSSTSGPKD